MIPGKRGNRLQGQCRLADTWITTDQRHAARYHAATECAIELRKAGAPAQCCFLAYVGELDRGGSRYRAASPGVAWRLADRLFQRVPGATAGALSLPLCSSRPALAADVFQLLLGDD